MNPALIVANSILQRAFEENIPLTPMKLQKLQYLTYKEYLKQHNKSLFEEDFQTWKFGPVLRTVYDEFRRFNASPISSYAYEDHIKKEAYVVSAKEQNFYAALDFIWKKYAGYRPDQLVDITHVEGGAWDKAKKKQQMYIETKDILEEEWV